MVNDLAGVAELGLVLVGPQLTRLLQPNGESFGCVANLERLPLAERVIAGNFTDNPGGEFLLLSQNQLSIS